MALNGTTLPVDRSHILKWLNDLGAPYRWLTENISIRLYDCKTGWPTATNDRDCMREDIRYSARLDIALNEVPAVVNSFTQLGVACTEAASAIDQMTIEIEGDVHSSRIGYHSIRATIEPPEETAEARIELGSGIPLAYSEHFFDELEADEKLAKERLGVEEEKVEIYVLPRRRGISLKGL